MTLLSDSSTLKRRIKGKDKNIVIESYRNINKQIIEQLYKDDYNKTLY